MQLGILLALFLLLSEVAKAEGAVTDPKVIFDDVGGVTFVFDGSSLDLDRSAISLAENQAVFASKSTISGCIIKTRNLPVYHGKGWLESSLQISMRWRGEIRKPISFEAIPLLQINMDVMDQDGRIRKSYRDGLDSGFTDYQIKTYEDDEFVTYIMKTNGTKRYALGSAIPVESGDWIRMRICFVETGTSFVLNTVSMHSYPIMTDWNFSSEAKE